MTYKVTDKRARDWQKALSPSGGIVPSNTDKIILDLIADREEYLTEIDQLRYDLKCTKEDAREADDEAMKLRWKIDELEDKLQEVQL